MCTAAFLGLVVNDGNKIISYASIESHLSEPFAVLLRENCGAVRQCSSLSALKTPSARNVYFSGL